MIDSVLKAIALKHVDRAGWLRAGISHPESVAAHSWGVCMLVLCLAPDELDLELALSYATLHDLAEAITGDFTPADGVLPDEKSRLEHEAMEQICAELPPRVMALWEAYERQEDSESRFVRQVDRLDMALQALRYNIDGGHHTNEFIDSATAFITHPALTGILENIRRRAR